MGQIKQALICGYGGQGIVLAGAILGRAAFNDGKWVGGTNSYGAASRGGACRAEVVISDQPISFPYVIEADVLIAMYQSAYDKYIGQVKIQSFPGRSKNPLASHRRKEMGIYQLLCIHFAYQ